jgi:hypothetical protein
MSAFQRFSFFPKTKNQKPKTHNQTHNPTMQQTTDPTATASKPKRRSALNTRQVAELDLTEEVAIVAAKPEFAPALARLELDAAFLSALRGEITSTRQLAGGAVSKTVAKQDITRVEKGLRDDLSALLKDVQKAAKQKVADGANRSLLNKYLVGERIDRNRARIEQVAVSFIAHAPADNLPGIDAEVIGQMQDALEAYDQIESAQSGAQGDASTDRRTLAGIVLDIARRRRRIQHAADRAWPARNRDNAPIRRQFKLPAYTSLK